MFTGDGSSWTLLNSLLAAVLCWAVWRNPVKSLLDAATVVEAVNR